MRYDAEHKQQTRQRVLKEAAEAIRNDGPHKVAVAGVMARAGLTHGGFYAHFASKDALVAAAIEQMFEDGRQRLVQEMQAGDPAKALAGYIRFYLSKGHRDSRVAGCPLPYLAADAPRLPAQSQERYGEGVEALTQSLAALIGDLGIADPAEEASSLLSELVGALSLARAVRDSAQSDAILERSRTRLLRRLGLEAGQ